MPNSRKTSKRVTIILYIMRHGDAEPAQALSADAIRPLSDDGEEEVLRSTEWLATELKAADAGGLDLLICSPYVRARQTAAIVESKISVERQLQNNDVTPDGDPAVFADWLFTQLPQQGDPIKRVAVVSHMPFVSYLVAELDPASQPMLFQTAGIAELTLDCDKGRGRFQRMAGTEPDWK